MNDDNPYQPPNKSSPELQEKQTRGIIPAPIVRIVVGILGAFFVAPALWVLIVMTTEQHTLAELSIFPAMVGGGIAIGWGSYSRFMILRVLAWSAAGLGVGLVLEAILMGGLSVGTFITPSGMVLGILGAILAFSAGPKNAT